MKIIGHRGARGLAPENTLAALRKALEHNVDEIEFDVRVTKDHVPVLMHGKTARDASGALLAVSAATYDQLKAHKPDLATLAEAIDFVGGAVPLLIEVKPGVVTQPIVKLLRTYLDDGWQPDKFLLGSFSQKTLRGLHNGLPEIEKVINEKWYGIRAHLRARQVHATRISLWNGTLYGWYISMASHGKYNLIVWTLNDPKKARRWECRGLYAVITDFPNRFEK